MGGASEGGPLALAKSGHGNRTVLRPKSVIVRTSLLPNTIKIMPCENLQVLLRSACLLSTLCPSSTSSLRPETAALHLRSRLCVRSGPRRHRPHALAPAARRASPCSRHRPLHIPLVRAPHIHMFDELLTACMLQHKAGAPSTTRRLTAGACRPTSTHTT